MTYEEAKLYVVHGEYFRADEMILAALEKQIPKPKHKYMGYRCVCGEEVAKNQRFCEYCGQRLLDWSEEA